MLFSVPSFRFSVGDLSSAVGKWSRVATFGAKSKDGSEMVFDATTLGAMVTNAAARGDKIAICQDHLSAYVAQTGQPAPALGYFTALAVVAAGRVVRAWNGQPEASGLPDGLYALLGEVTPRGLDPKDGLANYAFLSPMFSMAAKGEDGSDVGPMLYDVAATNTPFQSGTEIQFHSFARKKDDFAKIEAMFQSASRAEKEGRFNDAAEKYLEIQKVASDPGDIDAARFAERRARDAERAERLRARKYSSTTPGATRRFTGAKMDDTEMAKRFGFEPDDDDEKKAEKTAKFWADYDEKMASIGKAVTASADPGKDDEANKMAVQLAAVAASNAALMARLAAVEAGENARKAAVEAEQNARIEALADAAITGGYPKDARAAFVTFARADFAAAQALAAPHIKGAPAHLFARVSAGGAPIGAPRADGTVRADSAGKLPKVYKTAMFGIVTAPDEPVADEIKAMAFSTDPAVKAKVDAKVAALGSPDVPWARLFAAGKIVDTERPELGDQTARVRMALSFA